MRIAMQTWGSLGDIRPFLALAGGLAGAGHKVTLAVTDVMNNTYSAYAQDMGFTVRHVATPVITTQSEYDKIGIACVNAKNPIKQLKIILERLYKPAETAMFDTALELCGQNDLFIRHFFIPVLKTASDKYQIPDVSVALAHNVLPSRFIHPTGLPRLGSFMDGIWWKVIRKILNLLFLKEVNAHRLQNNLPPARDLIGDIWHSKHLNLLGVSPRICNRPPDWGEENVVCGFFDLPDTSAPEKIPGEVQSFLSRGEPVFYVTFGSLTPKDPENRLTEIKIVQDALHRTNSRAIIQMETSDIPHPPRDNRMLYTTSLLHKNIFPHCAAVIHHGGAGTTQTTLKSGVPSIVVAHISDQFFWGDEMNRLGVAPRRMTIHEFSGKRLAKAIRQVLNNPSMKEKAGRLGRSMLGENGVDTAVQLVNERFN